MFGVMNKAYVCSTSAHAQPRKILFCFSLVKSQQATEELKIDIKIKNKEEEEDIVQELCESRGGRPELSVLTSLLASVDVKIY